MNLDSICSLICLGGVSSSFSRPGVQLNMHTVLSTEQKLCRIKVILNEEASGEGATHGGKEPHCTKRRTPQNTNRLATLESGPEPLIGCIAFEAMALQSHSFIASGNCNIEMIHDKQAYAACFLFSTTLLLCKKTSCVALYLTPLKPGCSGTGCLSKLPYERLIQNTPFTCLSKRVGW